MRSDAVLLLKKLVEQAGGPLERGYLLALDGEGLGELPESIPTSRGETYLVARPRTELALRRLLWKSGGAPLIALVPDDLARRLPPDLIRRAHGARVQALEPADVLSSVLGIRLAGVDDDVVALALAHLDEVARFVTERTLPTVIDRRLLDELVVDACVGRRLRAMTATELVAAWLRAPPKLEGPARALLERTLPQVYPGEGRLIVWALETPERFHEIVVSGLLLAVAEDVPESAWGALIWAPGYTDGAAARRDLRVRVARLAEGVMDVLRASPEAEATASLLLRKAEDRGRRYLPRAMLAQSRYLPLGLENACADIARRIGAGEPVTDAEVQALRAHRAAATQEMVLDVLAQMARLGRFLAMPEATPETTQGHIVRYLRDGAFADVTAARLRRLLAVNVDHQHTAEALLARYRERRDTWNGEFARTLAAGYQRALHADGVVPLHRLWRDHALPKVDTTPLPEGADKNKRRGMFLVVLDGCSYPVFLELIEELAAMTTLPIGLTVGPSGEAMGTPALAPLPTITSHARGAIFLGEVPKDAWAAETIWRDTQERVTDPARFRQNPHLSGRMRQLFLKGDLADGGVALRSALADTSVDVVAAVFNAIDDQIGSANTGAMVKVGAAAIGGLLPALREAFRAARLVLVVADHGHSPWWSKDLRVGNGATPRFKTLAPGEAPPDGWIEVDLQGLGDAGARQAFAWRMGSHQGSPQVGFHGGCALEEMVVPMAWLQEKGFPADQPVWWFGSAREAPAPKAPPRKERSTPAGATPKASRPQSQPQRELFVADLPAPRASQLARLGLPDAVLAELDDAERGALAALAQNGSVRARDLAKAIARPLARMSGFMIKLHRKLHAAGHDVFRTETLPDGETQYTVQGGPS